MASSPSTITRSPSLAGHLPALDGLRGIAILLVLFYHMTLAERADSGPLSALQLVFRNFGWCGVDLFFVLSGFLITGLLYEAKPLGHYFRNFYARRVLRIFPLYYGYLAAVFLLLPLSAYGASRIASVRPQQLWYWLYLQNYLVAWEGEWRQTQLLDHLWSLAIEEQFYMIWPIVVLALGRGKLLVTCLAAAAFSLMLRGVLFHRFDVSPVALYVMTPTRLDGLALGAWLALAARGSGGVLGLVPLAKRTLVCAVVALAAIFVMQGTFSYHNKWVFTAGFSLLAALFAAVLCLTLAARPQSRLARVMSSSGLRMFGRYSYALYVFHQPVIMLVDPALSRLLPGADPLIFQLARYALALPLSLAAALVGWNLYEKHFLRLKRYFHAEKATPNAQQSTGDSSRPVGGN